MATTTGTTNTKYKVHTAQEILPECGIIYDYITLKETTVGTTTTQSWMKYRLALKRIISQSETFNIYEANDTTVGKYDMTAHSTMRYRYMFTILGIWSRTSSSGTWVKSSENTLDEQDFMILPRELKFGCLEVFDDTPTPQDTSTPSKSGISETKTTGTTNNGSSSSSSGSSSGSGGTDGSGTSGGTSSGSEGSSVSSGDET